MSEGKEASDIDMDAEIAAAEQLQMEMSSYMNKSVAKTKTKAGSKVVKKKKKAQVSEKNEIQKMLKQLVNNSKPSKIDTMANLALFNG